MTLLIRKIGCWVLRFCATTGSISIFLAQAIATFFAKGLHIKGSLIQFRLIGVNSFFIVTLTGFFAGAVLALQSYSALRQFGSQSFVGPLVALSLTRELGPVLTGLMVTGRAGSAMAAEIATMKITEQLDALKSLSINLWHYLFVPRICASIFALPLLTLFTIFFGTLGGYCLVTLRLGLSGQEYLSSIQRFVDLYDVIGGLAKSAIFGMILAWVACFKGLYTEGGARDVGVATTQAVVLGSTLILIMNYLLTLILF